MLSSVRLLHKWLVVLFKQALAVLMFAVFIVVFLNAFWRYTAGKSFIWGEEFAVYAMIFGVMLGLGLAYLQDRHVRFSVFIDLLPEKILRWNLVLVDLCVLAIGVGLAWSGYEFLTRRGNIVSPGLDLPMWLFQSSTLAGGVSLAVAALVMGAHRIFNVTLEGDDS